MNLNFKLNKKYLLFFILCFSCFYVSPQGDTSTFKAQFALGLNKPSAEGFVEDFQGNTFNFPTVNLGLQYMFSSKLGTKLDYGFSRISNKNNTPEFKLNYSRINTQVVYNATNIFAFLPYQMGTFIHGGPGLSIVKPLGSYTQNNISNLNALVGIEFHYAISDKLSGYLDGSYIFGFGSDFNPITNGYGSFNGNLLTITIGASISLSGCYYCEQND
ncbi:MAG: cell envelope biogenesis protein OmpA [Tamlana sp.]|jgi:hypothetical protein